VEEITIDKIIRSKRRSVALVIAPDATLTVRAPIRRGSGQAFWVSDDYIRHLVAKKQSWIVRKQAQMKKNEGVVHRTKKENRARFLEHRDRALQVIKERADHYVALTGWRYSNIRITDTYSRWGSCSSDGSVYLSWRLILAPLPVIDYVVVHELAHLTEKNHSARFWAKVRSIVPDWKERRRWLRENPMFWSR